MPKLRSLTGQVVIGILTHFGFSVIRIKGSHHTLRRIVEKQSQTISVAVYGRKAIPIGTLRTIYRDACRFIPEKDIKPYFYTE